MRIGVVNEDIWDFFREIFEDLSRHHETSLFKRKTLKAPYFRERLNRYHLRKSLSAFTRSNEAVFFEWAGEVLVEATRLPKNCGIVARIHRYDLYEWADKVNWDSVDTLILVSKAKQKEFSRSFPEHAHRVVVIPEAVSLERFKFHPKPFRGRIGILCHLKPRKRVYDLVLNFYELAQKMSGLTLRIGGDRRPLYADYHEALHRLVDNLGLRDRVTFDGFVAEPESWYRDIDIFVSNSYSEGLQVSPMEAIASGCYCLSHYWDGADELLPEENLFYTGRELQEKISAYCEVSEEERRRKQSALRQIVAEQFDLAKTSAQIRRLIEEARFAG